MLKSLSVIKELNNVCTNNRLHPKIQAMDIKIEQWVRKWIPSHIKANGAVETSDYFT